MGSIEHLDDGVRGFEDIPKNLRTKGETRIQGIRVVAATKRLAATGLAHDVPVVAWWPNDNELMGLDSTHRPLVDALLSDVSSAPIWLTAFGIDVDEPVGVREGSGIPVTSIRIPIVVTSELQKAVKSRSSIMTLSSNGIHDSCGPEFLAAVRPFIKNGSATPESVAVAALRVGWWPRHIPELLKKLGA